MKGKQIRTTFIDQEGAIDNNIMTNNNKRECSLYHKMSKRNICLLLKFIYTVLWKTVHLLCFKIRRLLSEFVTWTACFLLLLVYALFNCSTTRSSVWKTQCVMSFFFSSYTYNYFCFISSECNVPVWLWFFQDGKKKRKQEYSWKWTISKICFDYQVHREIAEGKNKDVVEFF